MRISDVKVQPVFAKNTLNIKDGDIIFPETFQFGQDFEYLLGTGNSLFAEFVATAQKDPGVVANPAFGLNVNAMAEFRGEPWVCEIEADASQVWKYVRESAHVDVNYGWFKVASADYLNIVRTLDKAKNVKLHMTAGSLDLEKYGAQIFEMGKQIFQSINTDGGGDFFKFEPNPQPQGLSMLGLFGGWSCSINASYHSESFTQHITYKNTLQFDGNFKASVGSAMTLAVGCNTATKQYFNELGNPEPCVTGDKSHSLQDRLEKDATYKRSRAKTIEDKLLSGNITIDVYNLLMKRLDSMSIEDGALLNAHPPLINDIDRKILEGQTIIGYPELLDKELAYIASRKST